MTSDEARLKKLEEKIEHLQRVVRELELSLKAAQQAQNGIFSR